jgi:cell division septal protein FtsQ
MTRRQRRMVMAGVVIAVMWLTLAGWALYELVRWTQSLIHALQ